MADEQTDKSSSMRHPVKDIVLPLATVIGLCLNCLFVGVAWGKITTIVQVMGGKLDTETKRNDNQDTSIQACKDKTRELERDAEEQRRMFLHLDDYTRGRIDRMPYKAPPPAIWRR